MITESIFRAAFWVLLTSLWVMRVDFMRRVHQVGERPMPDRKAIERGGRGLFIGRTVVLLFLAAVLVLYAFDSPWLREFSIPLTDWLHWAGFGLGLFGLGLWTWTQAELGKEYSPQLQSLRQHRLLTSGPYTRMRHPMYTAMFGEGIAFALVTANWCLVLFAVAMITGFVIRAPREEQMMIAAFGNEYRDYMQRAGRFFPKL
jgi:protein-S-isoprenylcysteine O-methyltransferase Ste14